MTALVRQPLDLCTPHASTCASWPVAPRAPEALHWADGVTAQPRDAPRGLRGVHAHAEEGRAARLRRLVCVGEHARELAIEAQRHTQRAECVQVDRGVGRRDRHGLANALSARARRPSVSARMIRCSAVRAASRACCSARAHAATAERAGGWSSTLSLTARECTTAASPDEGQDVYNSHAAARPTSMASPRARATTRGFRPPRRAKKAVATPAPVKPVTG